MITPKDVAKQLGTKVLKPIKKYGRHYFDAWTTSFGSSVSTPGTAHRVNEARPGAIPPGGNARGRQKRSPK